MKSTATQRNYFKKKYLHTKKILRRTCFVNASFNAELRKMKEIKLSLIRERKELLELLFNKQGLSEKSPKGHKDKFPSANSAVNLAHVCLNISDQDLRIVSLHQKLTEEPLPPLVGFISNRLFSVPGKVQTPCWYTCEVMKSLDGGPTSLKFAIKSEDDSNQFFIGNHPDSCFSQLMQTFGDSWQPGFQPTIPTGSGLAFFGLSNPIIHSVLSEPAKQFIQKHLCKDISPCSQLFQASPSFLTEPPIWTYLGISSVGQSQTKLK